VCKLGSAINNLARGVSGLPSDNALLQVDHDQGSGDIKFAKRHEFSLYLVLQNRAANA
jgi:hypothetical protein